MIQSYKQNPKVDHSYDVIIIGTGLGGLATAAFLSKTGKKVLLLERHYTAGGFTHTFKRKDFEWDVGIHYVGQMQNPGSAMRKLFDYISDGQMKWEDMGEVYDRIIIGDRKYNLVKGLKNWKKKMLEYFPEEKEALEKYISLIFAANKAGRNYQMEKALPPMVSRFIGGFLKNPLYKYSDKTTYEILNSITKNKELIKVLSGQYGDYGLPPKKSSFYMHAILVSHYFGGGSFPVGGSSQIVKTIDPVIEKAGGTILTNAEVDQVIIENNVAKGVLMKDGRSFFAGKIVSNTGVINTFKKLLPDESIKKHHLDQKLQKINPSVAHVCLYLGLDGSPEELKLPKTNLWIYPDDCDHDTCVERYAKDTRQPFPVVYISFPSAKDPDWKNRYPGKSTIEIIAPVPFGIFTRWNGTKWMKRGDDYIALKEKFTKRLLDELYRQLPHLKGKITYTELSSPLTTQFFVNYEKGEIYGVDHTPERFRQDFLKPRTPIKNFYLTGQDIVSCGIGGALFSGVLTATAMTGTNFINKVMKAK
jgi:all-trans-retinol 13,14-reductase